MPSHKAKFRWNSRKREITDQETVTNEHGTFKIGGLVTERRSASRGGIHVCSIEGTWRIPKGRGEEWRTEGEWRIVRPDGSIHSEGVIDGTWGGLPKPSDAVLEEISAGG